MCARMLKQLSLFSLEKRGLGGILSIYLNTWREGTKEAEPGSFQGCPVAGPETLGTDWNTGGSIWTSGNTSLLWGWLSTDTGCLGRWWESAFLEMLKSWLDIVLDTQFRRPCSTRWPPFQPYPVCKPIILHFLFLINNEIMTFTFNKALFKKFCLC